MAEVTVVFADLTGSTGVFESLGNARATKAITRLTQWIGQVCALHEGHVVKNLGDGVLMVFAENRDAVNAVVELQRQHRQRIRSWPDSLKMKLQIGLASGEIVEQEGDCFGDAVNLASRLSDLAGPEQILATSGVVEKLGADNEIRTQCLGALDIRGRIEACVVHRIEWQSDVKTDFLTVPASFAASAGRGAEPPVWAPAIDLVWLDLQASFTQSQLPLTLGRDTACSFVIEDPRVSRRHATLEYRAGRFHLEDTSSYGTWVRFADSSSVVSLRRQECVLLMDGEIALGAPFEDFTVPTVNFKFCEPGSLTVRGRIPGKGRVMGER
jgi:adenylate cyclase